MQFDFWSKLTTADDFYMYEISLQSNDIERCGSLYMANLPNDFQWSGSRAVQTSTCLGNVLRRMWCFKAEHQTQWMQVCVYCWNVDWFSVFGLNLFASLDRLLTWTCWNKTLKHFCCLSFIPQWHKLKIEMNLSIPLTMCYSFD